MSLLKTSAPHLHGAPTTATLMRLVCLALLPGIAALTAFFGFGTLTNLLWCALFALGSEALALALRQRPVRAGLGDGSALLTALLLAIALPPAAPWWLLLIASASAILLAKQLFGGLGHNPFNPAMVGYAIALVSFPLTMTQWPAPRGAADGTLIGPIDALLRSLDLDAFVIDGYTMATPLDLVRQNSSLLVGELWARNPQFGTLGGTGWEWVNGMLLLGGLFLLYRRVFTWHAPLSMLAALALMALLFNDGSSSASGGSPLFHLFSGATMLGAFFIVTDPVTAPVSTRGRLIGGAAIGVLVYLIRHWGNYPDAIAFAVLLLNFVTPLLDCYTQPRAYGHKPSRANDEH